MKKNLLKTGIIWDLQVTLISFLLCFKQNQTPEKKNPFHWMDDQRHYFHCFKAVLEVTTHHVGGMAITMHVLHCIYMRVLFTFD